MFNIIRAQRDFGLTRIDSGRTHRWPSPNVNLHIRI